MNNRGVDPTNTVEAVLLSVYGLKGAQLGTDVARDGKAIIEAQQALDNHYLTLFMDLIGADEESYFGVKGYKKDRRFTGGKKPVYGTTPHPQASTRNQLKAELRTKAKQLLGGES